MTNSTLRFKNPPRDMGLNQKLPNGEILMHVGGHQATDKAEVAIRLNPTTNVVSLYMRTKGSMKIFAAPVSTLLREPGTSLFQLARVAARTGVVFPKRHPTRGTVS